MLRRTRHLLPAVAVAAAFALASPIAMADAKLPRAGFAALQAATGAFAILWHRERRRARAARREALVDPLTGIPNRQAFYQRLSSEWSRARRYDRSLGLLLLDMDDLKQINDGHGHAAGDRAIREVAASVASGIREFDCAARLAGDEFVVLCPETGGWLLERVSEVVHARLDDRDVRVSIGVAEYDPGDESPEDMLARADAAMYEDKARRSAEGPADQREQLLRRANAKARPALATSGSSATRAS